MLDSLKINYEEKEVFDQEIQKQEAKQELPKREASTPPVVIKAISIELTPEEILKMRKEMETCEPLKFT